MADPTARAALRSCPICGSSPGEGTTNRSPGRSFYCSGRFREPHTLLSGGYRDTWAEAAATWNAAVASYRPPAPGLVADGQEATDG